MRSIREECLDHVVLLGERHLRTVVSEYVAHYHGERNHQGIGNVIIAPGEELANEDSKAVRRQRLGGLLNYYHREAA